MLPSLYKASFIKRMYTMAASARDQVKTMVPKVCNTFDSHPEVKQRRATEVFFTSKSQVSSFTAYNWTARPSKILLYDA